MQPDSASNLDHDDRTAEFLLAQPARASLNAYILTLNPHWADAEDIAQERDFGCETIPKYQPGTDLRLGQVDRSLSALKHRAGSNSITAWAVVLGIDIRGGRRSRNWWLRQRPWRCRRNLTRQNAR
jgi:hypothetical protein